MDKLLTTPEVAAVLGVHPKHVYRLLKRGLPGRRIGGQWRFSREDVLAWTAVSQGARPLATHPDPSSPNPRDLAVSPGAWPLATPPLVAANGDVVVDLLLAAASPMLGLVRADRDAALELLRTGAVLAAGGHGGPLPARFGDRRLARIHLVEREVGLVFPRGARAPALKSLPRLRLASRPTTAGVRRHLDHALAEAGVTSKKAHTRAVLHDSHDAVVAAVARGEADVGLATRAAGARLGLGFTRLAVEPYGLLVDAGSLGDPRVVRICELAQSRALRASFAAVPGYDARGSGDIRYDD